MTLTEYLNQIEPKRMPNVILNENEVIRYGKIKSGNDILELIEVKGLWEHFRVGRPYLQINGSSNLFTTDEHGNKKALSCFTIQTA